MLKQRVITAIVLLSVLGILLFNLSCQGFTVLAALIFLLGGWEWSNMAGFTRVVQRIGYLAVLLMAMLATAMYTNLWHEGQQHRGHLQQLLGLGGLWWAVALLWVTSYPASSSIWGSRLVCGLMGILVLVPSCLGLIYLRSLDKGLLWILYVFAIVIVADTGAYFAGRRFGKKKLLPAVSPGKSWAGFWGGMCCVLLLSVVSGQFGSVAGLSSLALIGVTLFSGLASVLGDLLESMVKRHRGIKDSGNLLPGHGGVMDRIDSITAAAPVFALLVLLLGEPLAETLAEILGQGN